MSNLKLLGGDILALYMTEEEFIEEDLFWILGEANRQGGKLIEFERIRNFVERLDTAELPMVNGEFNPTLTGCYTTRITVKQMVRRAENLLMEGEMLAAIAGVKQDFGALWHELFLAQFHDAACGCHTDAVYEQVYAKLRQVIDSCEKIITDSMTQLTGGNGITVFNPSHFHGPQMIGGPVPPEKSNAQRDGDCWYWTAELPPHGVCGFAPGESGGEAVEIAGTKFKTDYFEVDFSDGLPVIRTCDDGCQVFGPRSFGEILFRADYGSMWVEALESKNHGVEDQEFDAPVIESGPVFVKVVQRGRVKAGRPEDNGNLDPYWPGFEALSFTYEYCFPQHLDYFKLKLTLNWRGANTKIAVKFPVELKSKDMTALYEVPFGALERRPYFEVPYEYEDGVQKLNPGDYRTAKGDWPALNWVDYSDNSRGLAVANTGTPGHQLVGGDILVSLLRSGTLRADGGMVPQPGSYDNGVHCYEFAFRPHRAGEQYKALELGWLLNHPPRVSVGPGKKAVAALSFLHWNARQVALSGWYRDGDAWVVRLYEALGATAFVNLKSDLGKFTLFETDIAGENPVKTAPEKIKFRPFEIKTFKLVHQSK